MALIIEPLILSYPQFVLGEIINPDHANQNNYDISNKVNEFINEVITTRQMATDAQTDATDAIDIANTKGDAATLIANTKGDEAILIANTKGDSAIGIANATTSVANAAVVTANSADGKADTAISTSNSAVSTADSAVLIANTADGKATTAVSTVDIAVQAAENAIVIASQAVVDAQSFVGNTEIVYDVYTIVAANNGDGTFTYNNGTANVEGVITPEGYQRLILSDSYHVGRNRIEATINDTLTRSQASGGLKEVGADGQLSTMVDLTYTIDAGSEVTFKYYKQLSLGGKHGAAHGVGGSDEVIGMKTSLPVEPYSGQLFFKVVG